MKMDVNDLNFKQEVLDESLPVLVDFWAEWCGPCRMIAPVVEQIAKKYKGQLKVCKVDVDNAPKTTANYGIISVPTLVIFKKGKIAGKVIGALSKSELEKAVKKFI